MATINRPLLVLSIVLGVILVGALVLTFLTDRVQSPGTPTLDDRRLIDGDPTPPDRVIPPSPPIDPSTTPTPILPPPTPQPQAPSQP